MPLGVVGIIYEARPNVTADAAGLCLKSGNAVLLRGSSSAARSNAAIVAVLRDALRERRAAGRRDPAGRGDGRDVGEALMRARGLVDVLIPRGGAGLIRSVVERVDGAGDRDRCGQLHVYVDADADLDQALAIIVNSKTQRPSVCNAAETLLVHADGRGRSSCPAALTALQDAGVTVHGDERVRAYRRRRRTRHRRGLGGGVPLARHRRGVSSTPSTTPSRTSGGGGAGTPRRSSRDRWPHARSFVATVDSAAVMVNASTRFTDGGEFGFGAEIGISTQKLHARGPMGLAELTTTTFVVTGDGHVRR